MARINVLSQHTANQIAAGEVVERPASVVKELLENSLDAGATAITVETRAGGTEYIRVTDNGSGIEYDDVETAFLRHATSKIADAADLESIATLGFRGEALASIAAVAKVTLKTKTRDAQTGVEITVCGGKVISTLPSGCPDGTSIEVTDLFYNVPARLKFMKSGRAEAAYISDYVSRMIMAEPETAIKLIQSEKTVYQSAGDGSFDNALFTVYGAIKPYIKTVQYDDGYVRISGAVGTEQLSKLNRNQQSFYVNRRYIKSQKLSFALQRAFDARLMSGRFPFAALNISIAPEEIDVNVHPNKLDIRFKDENRVIHALVTSVKTALGDYAPPAVTSHGDEVQAEVFGRSAEIAENAVQASENDAAVTVRDLFDKDRLVTSVRVGESMGQHTYPCTFRDTPARVSPVQSQPAVQTVMDAQPYRIIGQFFDCYWAVQQGDKLFFIDQHAAHERKLYEELREGTASVASQQLLMPLIINLQPHEYALLFANIELFGELGFEIDEFGANTVSVRAIPHIMGQPQTEDFLRDALAILERTGRLTAADVKRRELIQSACKHAVKAGAQLDSAEIAALLDAYLERGIPLTCPHGRPVMITMSKTEFEKLFNRIV